MSKVHISRWYKPLSEHWFTEVSLAVTNLIIQRKENGKWWISRWYILQIYVSLLDSRTNLFSDRSSVFSNPDCLQLKDLAFKLCNYYGTEIVSHELSAAEAYMKSHPLGFADGQHLFGFYYNTPDNTLPIFWCKSPNWSPAFVRYGKVYGIEGVCISDEQYW